MCEKIIMTSSIPSRIKYLVQETIFHNKNITELTWTKHEHKKRSNYKQSIKLSVIF